jgi:hypothetical protein
MLRRPRLPGPHLFCAPLAILHSPPYAREAKRSQEICRGVQRREGRPRDGEHDSDRLLSLPREDNADSLQWVG